MPPLPSDLRKTLENTIVAARDTAEAAARAALITLAVERAEPFATMSEDQRGRRRALRAKARQLGGGDQAAGIPLLVEEIAYQQWHRMLFARFLAENNLLMHPQGVPVTLEDCAELAAEEGAADAWELAARYAGAMLPGIFLAGDPAVQVRFAPESRHALEKLVGDLPPAVFTADDGLGWVYQFWQSKRKDEVNRSERKIGGADIGPVTQLFTEDYMVKFLLENTLGAWWAARHPDSPLVPTFTYLRWLDRNVILSDSTGQDALQTQESEESPARDRDPSLVTRRDVGGVADPLRVTEADSSGAEARVPAAGTFPGWPDRAAQVTMMDPCGGSGHFVVAEFDMLRRMRMEEEGLPEAEAADAVIRDNLFMLEIDPRCTQIAAFNLALAAWKAGGYRALPAPNIACSGIAVAGQLADWLRLAGSDPSTGSGQGEHLQTALERLWKLFRDAPTLGSLINPADVPLNERMFTAEYEEVAPLLERALAKERDDPAAAVLGAAAEGVAKAAKLLAGQYTLVATNVPYLARGKQSEPLRDFCQKHFPESKSDLATVFLERCLDFCTTGGTVSLVLPQNWLFLTTYRGLREKLLKGEAWHLIARLGPAAFDTISGEVVKATLIALSRGPAPENQAIHGLDISAVRPAAAKAAGLLTAEIKQVGQWQQLQNPESRVALDNVFSHSILATYAFSYQGIKTGDDARFRRSFWEVDTSSSRWLPFQGTVKWTSHYGGVSDVIDWNNDGEHHARRQGLAAWGKSGVSASQIGDLPASIYFGTPYDSNVSVIVPKLDQHSAAIWAFCASPQYSLAVRKIDQSLAATNAAMAQIPFDLDYWQSVAQEQYPGGLPGPWSNDPTQWLFGGHPTGASEPLQVAVARMLGYHWPQQAQDDLVALADADGIVPLPAVVGEAPAAERLRSLLARAYTQPPAPPDFERYRVGDYVPTTPVSPVAGWSLQTQERLLARVVYGGKSLDDWLRDGFFAQHCRLFHNRPFIWHVWDGRKDGFSALVNYHRLDTATLDKLIYTYLGNWIETQRAERDRGVAAADGRLVAGLELKKKLELIRDGEPPYDIYVRWKSLHEQPIGWDPDLNDGVRLNIRPFVAAGVLRSRFSIHWNKDRGKNPDGSERINDRHLTRATKLAARRAAAN